MRIACINGWSFGDAETRCVFERRFLNTEVCIAQAVEDWEARLEAIGSVDWLFGYSLGAFLLLSRRDSIDFEAQRVTLLAPFEDFKAEANRGGKTKRGQLSYLLKWLDRDAQEAVSDFRRRANLTAAMELQVSPEDLKWGIRTLRDESIVPGSLKGVESYLGREDPLLDAGSMEKRYPHIEVMDEVGHELSSLLMGVKE